MSDPLEDVIRRAVVDAPSRLTTSERVADAVRAHLAAIFAREIVRAEEDMETSTFIDWLERLRGECCGEPVEEPKETSADFPR